MENKTELCECLSFNGRLREAFMIVKTDYRTAMNLVIENHYLHRKAPCSFAFILLCKDCLKPAGTIVYGTPSSSSLRMGVCGPEHANNVIELTRLWIKDGTPKNSESFLIGNTLSLVNKEIIVSYADSSEQHVGTVYQATNWLYTGLSAKRTNWSVPGIALHSQTMADKYTSAQLREKYGEEFKLVDRPRKHRYVYFNCNSKRKKQLLKELRYSIQAYPKHKT